MGKKEFRIEKIEKDVYKIAYKYGTWGMWHWVDISFKSFTKAEEYITTHKD